jgi:hypothetical protein
MSNRANNRYGGLQTGGQTELVSSVIIPVVVFCLLFVFDYIYRSSNDKTLRFITLVDYTANSSDGVVIIPQDPSNPNAVQVGVSVNERTGVEFAYSFFLNVKESTFSGNDEMRHVFHKGYRTAWPLAGPGVFIRGSDNTMVIVMNTNTQVYKTVDVHNIPVNKWFHVVLNCYKSGLDVYINGNIAHRISFKDGVVYQNFQDIILFSPNRTSISNMVTPAAGDSPINFAGSFDGQLSSLKYARYALSLKEIQALMGEGPSTKVKSNTMNTDTSYLSDTWWSNN